MFCIKKIDINSYTILSVPHFQFSLAPGFCTFGQNRWFRENMNYFWKKSKILLFFAQIELKTPFSLYATNNERKNWKKSFPSFCPNFSVFSKTAQNPHLSRDKASRFQNIGIPDMKIVLNSHKIIKTQLLRSRSCKKITQESYLDWNKKLGQDDPPIAVRGLITKIKRAEIDPR